MSGIAPTPPGKMTVAEFLDWAAREDVGRVELVDGEVVAMAGETRRHSLTKVNVAQAFRTAVDRSSAPCTPFVDGPAVAVDALTAFIPDVVVDCGGGEDWDAREIAEPTIVVEVLSASTGRCDRGGKFAGYFSRPEVAHYLIVDAIRRTVVHHRRNGDEIASRILGAAGALALTPPGLTVEIDDFWRGLPPQAPR